MKTEEKEPILTIHYHGTTIKPFIFNLLIGFVNQLFYIEKENVELITDVYPLRLDGKISQLTSLGKKWFRSWNKDGCIRNIRVLED